MSLLFKHPWTGGELHQAGAKEIPYLIRRNKIDLIIFAAQEYQPETLDKSNKQFIRAEKIYVPMKDSSKLRGKELKNTIDLAKFAANRASLAIIGGKNVLSTCWAGLNRSGLISGLILKKITREHPKKVVSLIRKNRSSFALFNPLFVKIIYTQSI